MSLDFLNMANAIRSLAVDAVQSANSGHAGMVLGMADVVTVLFARFLKFNPKKPKWPDRDRFVLSAGHGSMLLYALFYLTGYPDITLEDIKNFRKLHSKTAGHPEYGYLSGVENTSGPLGQGFGNAVGMAITEEMLRAKCGPETVNHYTYVVVGDGCLMEGLGYESASLAGHLKLSRLIVLFDDNSISIDGSTSLSCSEDHLKLFDACGWHVASVDGHHFEEVEAAIAEARSVEKPSLIACRTVIGRFMACQGTNTAHSGPVDAESLLEFKRNLGLGTDGFVVDQEALAMWRSLGSSDYYMSWQKAFEQLDVRLRDLLNGKHDVTEACSRLDELKRQSGDANPASREATRASSGRALSTLYQCLEGLVGGSADLTSSNNTKAEGMKAVEPGDFKADYIHYGVREHIMAACMNGMALHGGVIPYGGTFFVFTDYCRPAIRLSALMKVKVIYVMTHDSIGVGEDGPTHQPVEHLAALRSMPNVYVIRPADALETIEAWQLAIALPGPVILVLSRQKVPQLSEYSPVNRVAKGGYVLCESSAATSKLDVTLFATGSEVQLALQARSILTDRYNLGVRVVSLPCWELFFEQPSDYRRDIMDNDSFKVAIEAASPFGWDRIIGESGEFVGMSGFGASAPCEELYIHFDISADRVVRLCKEYFGL